MLPHHRLKLTIQIEHRLGLAKLSAFLCISWLPRAFCDSNRKRMSKNLLSLLLYLGLVSCYSLQSTSWSLPFETECLFYIYSAMSWTCVACYVFILQGLVGKRGLIRTQRRLSTWTFEQHWNKSGLLEKSFFFSLWGVHELWSLWVQVLWFWGYGLSPRFVITVKFGGHGTKRG